MKTYQKIGVFFLVLIFYRISVASNFTNFTDQTVYVGSKKKAIPPFAHVADFDAGIHWGERGDKTILEIRIRKPNKTGLIDSNAEERVLSCNIALAVRDLMCDTMVFTQEKLSDKTVFHLTDFDKGGRWKEKIETNDVYSTDLGLKIDDGKKDVKLKGTLRYGSLVPLLRLNNISTDSSAGSLFIASSNGGGYQAELESGKNVLSQMKYGSYSNIEIQKPFGNIITLKDSDCYAFSGFPSQYNSACVSDNNFFIRYDTIGVAEDFLNETGTKSSQDVPTDSKSKISPYDQNLNYVFLDTVINNSDVAYDIITIENINFYRWEPASVTKQAGIAEGSLIGAINTGKISIDAIIAAANSTEQKVTIGSQSYAVKYLAKVYTDDRFINRFTIFGKNQHDPSKNQLSSKFHMASPQLALSTKAGTGVQALIFVPTDFLLDSYQLFAPALLIGFDADKPTVYAYSYIRNVLVDYPFGSEGNAIKCTLKCTETKTDKTTNQEVTTDCAHDTIWKKYSANMGTGKVLKPGRIKIVISKEDWNACSDKEKMQMPYISKIELLPGLYWPGKQNLDKNPDDFTPETAKTEKKTEQKSSIATPPSADSFDGGAGFAGVGAVKPSQLTAQQQQVKSALAKSGRAGKALTGASGIGAAQSKGSTIK